MDGYSLFKKDRQGYKKEGAVALYLKMMSICSEVQYKEKVGLWKALCVKVVGESIRGNVMLGE